MRVLENPDSLSGPEYLSISSPTDQHNTHTLPTSTQSAYSGQSVPFSAQHSALPNQQLQRQSRMTYTDRPHFEPQHPSVVDTHRFEHLSLRTNTIPLKPTHLPSSLSQAPSQQSKGAGPTTGNAWNSRSGISPTHGLAAQAWAAPYSEPPQSQPPSHLPTPQTFLSPPGLLRPSFTPTDYGQTSTPGAYTPRTPHDYSPLPTPIARPQPFGEPGPSTVIAAAPRRRSSGKDEFDGPHQFLPKPDDAHIEINESQLIPLAISLQAEEQDDVLTKVNDCLSKCAFDFVAKYQFPIPIEADKRPVRSPGDREWTEWCHLLKRLATKRRIPMRVLWNGQIKQLVTVLENSLEMRHAAKHQSRPLKDDRNILQLISAGLQVAKMLKDPQAMIFLDNLYSQTERTIRNRTGSN